MKTYFTLFAFLLLTLNVFSQDEHEFVKLSEEKKGKRLTLYATNTDSISYDVFLRVLTKDYRRSSNRPMITNVPPNRKIKLLTLIQLAGSQGEYDATFIVNEVAQTLEVNKNHSGLDFRLDKAIKEQKVTLFTSNNCSICLDCKRVLENNRIAYKEYNIDKDSIAYLKIIKKNKPSKNNLKKPIPLLKIEDEIYNNINSIEDFTGALRKAFN